VDATSFLPVYLAAEHTYQEEGLKVDVLGFRGDAEVAQALAADSVDFDVASLNGLINMTTAGQPVKGFYAGFYQADFAWLALPSIKTWSDLKGKSAGISTYGALTDVLTRYVLKKHGLEPEKDVHMVQAGGTPQAFQAMKSGKLDSAIISPPYKWQGVDEGMTLLGNEDQEVAPEWPKHIFITKTKFLDDNPNTITALLRGHVAAVQLARRDKAAAVKGMMDRLKYTEAYASRGYDEVMPGFNERGTLPDKPAMSVFWDITMQVGDVTEPWPDAKLLDPRYVDTFDQWAPQ
jgi:NitT/TauT family transport system substrate-binding protein